MKKTPCKPYRYLVRVGRSESVHTSLGAAKLIAGKKGKIIPLFKEAK